MSEEMFGTIESLEIINAPEDMIDITVEGDHTYWVSETGSSWALTHNTSWPDIDSDTSDRDVLIDAARSIFGEDSVIPVSNFNTLKLKSLIKDISKFYDVPFEEVNDLTGPLQFEVEPKDRGEDVEKSVYVLTHDACMKHSSKYRAFMEKYPKVQEHVQSLFMQNRSVGRHAGGVLICPELEKHMPVIAVRGELQTPWTEGMNWRNLEDNGFLKFDFLGLSLMKMVEDCISLILRKKNPNEKPTFSQIKQFFDRHLNCRYNVPNDPKVWNDVYGRGRFPGIFQFTNDGARRFCVEAQPKSIIELAAITAIYRPGPLKANVHVNYVQAMKDPESVKFAHPVIETILGPTYGFICFQEQFMLLAQKLAGFSPGESDQMRKTLVKKSLDTNDKKSGERVELRKKFVEGAKNLHNLSEKVSNDLFDKIEYFSLYGFNLSHAVAYAIDSYYSAWLMTHYEKEWLATCLQSETGNPKGLSKIISEIKQLGYKLAPHDINKSDGFSWIYSHELEAFIPPLSSVKGVGKIAIREILETRPYRNLDDCLFDPSGEWRHSKMNKTCFDSLCKIGAFSSLEDFQGKGLNLNNHKQLHWLIIEHYDQLRKGRFGMSRSQMKKADKAGLAVPRLLEKLMGEEGRTLEDWNRNEKILMAYELTSAADESLLFPGEILRKFDKSGILRITEVPHGVEKISWFCVKEIQVRETAKNKKKYLRIRTIDDSSNTTWLKVWGADPDKMKYPIEPFTIWMCTAKGDSQWGPSTSLPKMRQIKLQNFN